MILINCFSQHLLCLTKAMLIYIIRVLLMTGIDLINYFAWRSFKLILYIAFQIIITAGGLFTSSVISTSWEAYSQCSRKVDQGKRAIQVTMSFSVHMPASHLLVGEQQQVRIKQHPKGYNKKCRGQDLNPVPPDRESSTQTNAVTALCRFKFFSSCLPTS